VHHLLLAKLEISQNQHSFANSSNDKVSGAQNSNNSTSGVFCSSSNGGKTTTNGSNGGQMMHLLGDRRAPGCEKTILKMAQGTNKKRKKGSLNYRVLRV
jgi:hypothetical protein